MSPPQTFENLASGKLHLLEPEKAFLCVPLLSRLHPDPHPEAEAIQRARSQPSGAGCCRSPWLPAHQRLARPWPWWVDWADCLWGPRERGRPDRGLSQELVQLAGPPRWVRGQARVASRSLMWMVGRRGAIKQDRDTGERARSKKQWISCWTRYVWVCVCEWSFTNEECKTHA